MNLVHLQIFILVFKITPFCNTYLIRSMAEAFPGNNNPTCDSNTANSNGISCAPVLPPPRLYKDINDDQLPIIYDINYDVSFLGFEKLHPFDTQKWGRIYKFLLEANLFQKGESVTPIQINQTELLTHHTPEYLTSLTYSANCAAIAEIPPIALIPNFFLRRNLLTPLQYQTGGTILAGKLAMERGWAINLGGGFHHCYRSGASGFCFYADISFCINYLFSYMSDRVQKVMIIDLDAHQGNGHERDFETNPKVFILDAYNRAIFPNDHVAKSGIDVKIELRTYTADADYMAKISAEIPVALNAFKPNIVIYNAGTDLLINDPLGALSITADGVIIRDEYVWKMCRSRGIPIVMVTSGGYLPISGRIVADSILNLNSKGLLKETFAEN